MIMHDSLLRLNSEDDHDERTSPAQSSVLSVVAQNDWGRNTADRLEMHRIGTLVADSAERGLSIARTRKPDAILLDLTNLSRSSLCQELALDPATRDIPRVAIGSGCDSDTIRVVREQGYHYFIAQPCDPSVLLVLVNHVVQRQTALSDAPSITV